MNNVCISDCGLDSNVHDFTRDSPLFKELSGHSSVRMHGLLKGMLSVKTGMKTPADVSTLQYIEDPSWHTGYEVIVPLSMVRHTAFPIRSSHCFQICIYRSQLTHPHFMQICVLLGPHCWRYITTPSTSSWK